ncbi:hypothetical protein EON80_01525, partial [bacterium]
MNIVKFSSSARKMLAVAFCALASLSVSHAQEANGRGSSKAPTNVELLDRILSKGGTSRFVKIDDMLLPRKELSSYRDKLKSAGSGPVAHSGFYVDVDYWTGGKVAYVFDPDFPTDGRNYFLEAAREWEKWANLKFSPRTTEENFIYVYRDPSDGSFSNVGMVGGAQELSLASWANKMTACHELAHALGVMHEQSRSDRDTYVTIDFANVFPGYEGNFVITPDSNNIGAYDFESVMHYGPNGFAIDPAKPTIICNPGYEQFQTVIGQRDHLTQLDKTGMATIYGYPITSTSAFSVSDASAVETDSNSARIIFSIKLDPPSEVPTTVFYTAKTIGAEKGYATLGQDFKETSDVVTFRAGESIKKISVPVVGDKLVEGNETFSFVLSGASGAPIATATATGTIIDDDAVPVISVTGNASNEGNKTGGKASFTVSLSSPTSKAVSVKLTTTNGSAVTPGDYTALNDKLITFQPRETSKIVNVPLVGDLAYEGDETFKLTLSAPTNGTLTSKSSTAVATILNDDLLPQVSILGTTLSEGAVAKSPLNFTVKLSNPSTSVIKVKFGPTKNVAPAATSGADYIAIKAGQLTFQPGETSKIIPVTVKDDEIDEEDENVSLTLTSATNATIVNANATGVIKDDDSAPSITVANISVTEGTAKNTEARFTINLSNPSSRTVTVSYNTADDTALAASDYKAAALTKVTFAPGETSKTVVVVVKADKEVEVDETFTLKLSAPVNAGLKNDTAIATIVNDDVAPPVISVNNPSITEGNSGTQTLYFTIKLSKSSTETVQFKCITQGGTATAGSDFIAIPITEVAFAPGITSQTFAVKIKGDTLKEADETFKLVLSSPLNATLATGGGEATIFNDDSVTPTPQDEKASPAVAPSA